MKYVTVVRWISVGKIQKNDELQGTRTKLQTSFPHNRGIWCDKASFKCNKCPLDDRISTIFDEIRAD